MSTDFLGNTISAGDPAAIDDFVDGFLSYEARAANILRAAEVSPESPLTNAYAAALWMFLEAPGAATKAAPYLARAEGAVGATERERMTTALVRAWSEDDIPRALAIGAELNATHPRDLTALKLRHYLQFNHGDFPGMLNAASGVFDANRDVAQMHGMIAFAYEQCHLLDEAEAASREALRLKVREPWAQHALAHVMLTQGRIGEGAAFLEDAAPMWTGLNSFMLTHQFWHLALFYLSQGKFDEALRLYDQNVWGVDKGYTQDQVGAVSLLARLEIAGVDVGPRWAELAEHLAPRAGDVVLPFLTLQYIYGLARAERPEADALLAAIRAKAGADKVWREVALPAAEGLVAHARGDYDTAVEQLGAALPRLAITGGSHAQRDLFEQIWLDALIHAGRYVAAQQALELRRKMDPDGAVVNAALARVYSKLGLSAQAAQAAARIPA